MGEVEHLEELKQYYSNINSMISKDLISNINNLTEMTGRLRDLGEINTAFWDVVSEQEKKISSLESELNKRGKDIEEKERRIKSYEDKEESYREIEVASLKVTKLLQELEEERIALNQERIDFEEERDSIIAEKEQAIKERDEARDIEKKVKKERDEAIVAKDGKIAECRKLEEEKKELISEKEELIEEKEDLIEEKKTLEDENKNLEQEKGQIEKEYKKLKEEATRLVVNLKDEVEKKEKDIEWYRTYAMATDRKILDYFNEVESELISHKEYLLKHNEDEERKEKFPSFVVPKNRLDLREGQEREQSDNMQGKEGENRDEEKTHNDDSKELKPGVPRD